MLSLNSLYRMLDPRSDSFLYVTLCHVRIVFLLRYAVRSEMRILVFQRSQLLRRDVRFRCDCKFTCLLGFNSDSHL